MSVLLLDRVIPNAILDLVACAVQRNFLPDPVEKKDDEIYRYLTGAKRRVLRNSCMIDLYLLIELLLGTFHIFEILVDRRVVEDRVIDSRLAGELLERLDRRLRYKMTIAL